MEDMDVLPRSRIKCILGCEYQGPLVCSTSLRGPNMTIVDTEFPNQACIRVFFLENELGVRIKSTADVIESASEAGIEFGRATTSVQSAEVSVNRRTQMTG